MTNKKLFVIIQVVLLNVNAQLILILIQKLTNVSIYQQLMKNVKAIKCVLLHLVFYVKEKFACIYHNFKFSLYNFKILINFK
jgi:hypothetical protein